MSQQNRANLRLSIMLATCRINLSLTVSNLKYTNIVAIESTHASSLMAKWQHYCLNQRINVKLAIQIKNTNQQLDVCKIVYFILEKN